MCASSRVDRTAHCDSKRIGRKGDKMGNIRFEDWEADQMRDPEFRAAAEELEPAYQKARWRIIKKLKVSKNANT